MPLLPLHQDDLRHEKRGHQDEHHLGVHGLVTPVLHMEPLVLHPADRKQLVGRRIQNECVSVSVETSAAHLQFSLCVILSSSS